MFFAPAFSGSHAAGFGRADRDRSRSRALRWLRCIAARCFFSAIGEMRSFGGKSHAPDETIEKWWNLLEYRWNALRWMCYFFQMKQAVSPRAFISSFSGGDRCDAVYRASIAGGAVVARSRLSMEPACGLPRVASPEDVGETRHGASSAGLGTDRNYEQNLV